MQTTIGEIYRILSLEGCESFSVHIYLNNHPRFKRLPRSDFFLLKAMFATMERKEYIKGLING